MNIITDVKEITLLHNSNLYTMKNYKKLYNFGLKLLRNMPGDLSVNQYEEALRPYIPESFVQACIMDYFVELQQKELELLNK